VTHASNKPASKGLLPLLSLNFFMADMQAGIGRVTLSQVATAIAGAAIGPAVSGITLGMVRQAGFNRQTGHNQALNHAGNMVEPACPACWGGNSALPPYSGSPLCSAFSRLLRY